jgi:hypothetical protein
MGRAACVCACSHLTLQNWLPCESSYSALSPSVLWSALLVAVFYVISPEHVASITATKIDEKTGRLVRCPTVRPGFPVASLCSRCVSRRPRLVRACAGLLARWCFDSSLQEGVRGLHSPCAQCGAHRLLKRFPVVSRFVVAV